MWGCLVGKYFRICFWRWDIFGTNLNSFHDNYPNLILFEWLYLVCILSQTGTLMLYFFFQCQLEDNNEQCVSGPDKIGQILVKNGRLLTKHCNYSNHCKVRKKISFACNKAMHLTIFFFKFYNAEWLDSQVNSFIFLNWKQLKQIYILYYFLVLFCTIHMAIWCCLFLLIQ